MGYHMEEKSYPNFEADVRALPTIDDVDGMECPCCGGRLWMRDYGYPVEKYTEGGLERTERFYCDDCGTFADVTQIYVPTEMRVKVMQDVFED